MTEFEIFVKKTLSQMTRELCILSGPVTVTRVKHTWVKGNEQGSFPPTRFLVVDGDNKESTGALLYRFDNNGDCVGDTWHKSLNDAKRDAANEYEGLVQVWEEIPAEIEDKDIPAFGLKRIKQP